MCTVSFIPVNDRVFITHNRDEKSSRHPAVPPAEYSINNTRLWFPRDGDAGGSWIACNENGGTAVLLNGAFTKHHHQPPYKKSRGLVLLDIVSAADLLLGYQAAPLAGIEPFTVLLWSNSCLYECRWDGVRKHIATLNPQSPYILSSVTLYNKESIVKREKWFAQWLENFPNPSTEEIIAFHLSAGEGDIANDLRMNRNGKMFTVSLTAMEITDQHAGITYLDLRNNSRNFHHCNFLKTPALP